MASTNVLKVMVDVEDLTTKHVGHAWILYSPSDDIKSAIPAAYQKYLNTPVGYYPDSSSVDWYNPTTYSGKLTINDTSHTADYTYTFNIDTPTLAAGLAFVDWYTSSPTFNLTTFNDCDFASYIMDLAGLNIETKYVISPSSLVKYIQDYLL